MLSTTTSVMCNGFAHMVVNSQHTIDEMRDTLTDIIKLVSDSNDNNEQVVKQLSDDFVSMHLNSPFSQISNSLRLMLVSFT